MKAKSVFEEDLRTHEREFIRRHDISIDEIIDVTGMSPIGQKRAMEARNARLAISNRLCTKGHRFKTRSNHCPQCESKNLAFEKRHNENAYVYVCVSLNTGLVKIGYAKDPKDRAARLNRERYATCSDWNLIFSVKAEKAGRIEFDSHSNLSKFRSARTYLKEGREVVTYEVFSCSREQAIEAVNQAIRRPN